VTQSFYVNEKKMIYSYLWKQVQTIKGKQHEIVQWKYFQTIAFANFIKNQQDTLIQFFSVVLDNVTI